MRGARKDRHRWRIAHPGGLPAAGRLPADRRQSSAHPGTAVGQHGAAGSTGDCLSPSVQGQSQDVSTKWKV